jgi:hypothetical protein
MTWLDRERHGHRASSRSLAYRQRTRTVRYHAREKLVFGQLPTLHRHRPSSQQPGYDANAREKSLRERKPDLYFRIKEKQMLSLMVAFLIALAVTPPDPF